VQPDLCDCVFNEDGVCPKCSVEIRLFKENTHDVEDASVSVTSADLRVSCRLQWMGSTFYNECLLHRLFFLGVQIMGGEAVTSLFDIAHFVDEADVGGAAPRVCVS
jgi:hypothetical protein